MGRNRVLDEMKRALTLVLCRGCAFEITIKRDSAGSLNPRRPRVFWAGVQGGEPLHALARFTEQAKLPSSGVPNEERDYSPASLPSARIRETVPLEPLHQTIDSFPAGCGFDFGTFSATEFFLYLSAGGKYTQLAGFPLV